MNANNNLLIGIAGPLPTNVNHDRAFRNDWYSDNCKLSDITGEGEPKAASLFVIAMDVTGY
jgi:hypothetical protein